MPWTKQMHVYYFVGKVETCLAYSAVICMYVNVLLSFSYFNSVKPRCYCVQDFFRGVLDLILAGIWQVQAS